MACYEDLVTNELGIGILYHSEQLNGDDETITCESACTLELGICLEG